MGRSWLCPLAAMLTVARNWASSLGKLAMYSSFTIYMYSSRKYVLDALKKDTIITVKDRS